MLYTILQLELEQGLRELPQVQLVENGKPCYRSFELDEP